jgi:ArsR family transcriptional regulator
MFFMLPEDLFNILSDRTRLRSVMLIQAEQEVCVCELTFTLEESQPKVSRHLALMRDAGLVTPRREGTWMHYRISRDLPSWARETIQQTYQQLRSLEQFSNDRSRLKTMTNRPREISCA